MSLMSCVCQSVEELQWWISLWHISHYNNSDQSLIIIYMNRKQRWYKGHSLCQEVWGSDWASGGCTNPSVFAEIQMIHEEIFTWVESFYMVCLKEHLVSLLNSFKWLLMCFKGFRRENRRKSPAAAPHTAGDGGALKASQPKHKKLRSFIWLTHEETLLSSHYESI